MRTCGALSACGWPVVRNHPIRSDAIVRRLCPAVVPSCRHTSGMGWSHPADERMYPISAMSARTVAAVVNHVVHEQHAPG